MLRGQDIIYFSNDWDADNKTSSHHIARQLSKYNRILYVEAGGLRPPRASSYDLRRISVKIKAFIKGIRRINNHIFIYTPLIFPFHKYRFIKAINRFILIRSLKFMCKKLGFGKPILWIIIPHISVVVGKLNEKLVVYYCVDNFSSLPGVDSKAIAHLDGELAKAADVVFTPSQILYSKKKKINPNTFLSPHGVDMKHFAKAVGIDLPIPLDIKAVKKPIVGFFGVIEKWIDLDLVKYIALCHPQWSLVFIGRVAADISLFDHIRNVHFFGARDYTLMPSYGRMFDIAIIPFVINDLVLSVNPIKLPEYLAMGKPVVAVKTPEHEKFSDVVRVAGNYQDFVKGIELELKEDSEEKVKQRMDRVRNLSWENCFEGISARMEQVLSHDR